MRMTHRFFMLLALSAVLVACGSKDLRAGFMRADRVILPPAVESEREKVFPHLHYSLDAGSVGLGRDAVELSFYFTRQQGDSLLWVECVEMVPLELIDTALCHRWFNYDYSDNVPFSHF